MPSSRKSTMVDSCTALQAGRSDVRGLCCFQVLDFDVRSDKVHKPSYH